MQTVKNETVREMYFRLKATEVDPAILVSYLVIYEDCSLGIQLVPIQLGEGHNEESISILEAVASHDNFYVFCCTPEGEKLVQEINWDNE